MALLLPERTVDSLFAYEFLSAVPAAYIFSPANKRGRKNQSRQNEHPDHFVRAQGRELVFECKTLYANTSSTFKGAPYVRIRKPQLDQYAKDAPNTIYVLPVHTRSPSDENWTSGLALDDPSNRPCWCGTGPCVACEEPTARRAAGGDPTIASWAWHERFQFFFSHWAWCVRASDLRAFLDRSDGIQTAGRPIVKRAPKSSNEDILAASLEALVQSGCLPAVRLCHLLAASQWESTGRHPAGNSAMMEGALHFLWSAQIEGGIDELPPISSEPSGAVTRTLVSYSLA